MVNDFLLARIPEIYFGAGKFRLLPSLAGRYGKDILIITGARSFPESPHYEKLKRELEARSIRHSLVKISGEPSPLLIDGIVDEYLLKDIDLVIAIGGGSVLDTGKAVSAMLTQDGFVQEFLEGVGTGRIHSGRKLPFIAVPTTAGTGSETTKNAVLSNVALDGFKKSLRHESFVPDIALIDPELTLTCPAEITAACGMDAFTQLLESYVSENSSAMTDTLCLNGLKHISTGLIKVVQDPGNLQARSDLSYAAMISGITLANAGLGTVHGFASTIGGHFDIPHGVICGTLVGAVTRANIETLLKKAPDHPSLIKYAEVGKIFSRRHGPNIKSQCLELIKIIDIWIDVLKIHSLGSYGIQPADFKKIAAETSQKHNPVKLEEEVLMNILKERI